MGKEVSNQVNVEESVIPKPPIKNLQECRLKNDHFQALHLLGNELKVDGAPNFRQAQGFPVFGTAQPLIKGFENVLSRVNFGSQEKPFRVIWFNMRSEPVIYINKHPFAPRDPDRMHENLNVIGTSQELEQLEMAFLDLLRIRTEISGDSTLKIRRDSAFTENRMERSDVLDSIKVKSLEPLQNVCLKLNESHPGLAWTRIPVSEDDTPTEDCLDMMVDALKNEPASTQCIFSCQMGRGRTTLGMIVACLIKTIQVTTKLKGLGQIRLVPEDMIEKLIATQFESKLPKPIHEDDPLLKGEFDVIKDLLNQIPEAKEGKKKLDRIIDICGPAPKGNGLQNFRECIIETKWKYDVAPEEKQVVWRKLILNFMERYFYLICFATYALEVGPDGFQTSFKAWMDQRPHLRVMITEGKDKIEWYRQVDPAKLNTLKVLMNAPDYKDNLGTLIKTIYEFAFDTYGDLPRGPIKNNSMRKLAAKTLMEIMPLEIHDEIQQKLDEHATSPDFITLIGLVSYHGRETNPEGL